MGECERRKIHAGGLLIIVCICMALIMPRACISYATSTDWEDIYRTFLIEKGWVKEGPISKMGSGQKSELSEGNMKFGVYDLDKDGTPELIMYNGANTEAGATSYLYRINNGKAIFVDTLGQRMFEKFYYVPGSKYSGLFFQNGARGYYPGYYYEMSNGKLKTEEVLYTSDEGGKFHDIQETSDDVLFSIFPSMTKFEYGTVGNVKQVEMKSRTEVIANGWNYNPAADSLTVKVNNESVDWTDATPYINSSGRTMVPLRAVGDALGLTVSWDNSKKEAVFTDGSKTIYFPIGSTTAKTSEGRSITMDTAAVITNNRTYAPVRYLAEYFGYNVSWDNATRTVSIMK